MKQNLSVSAVGRQVGDQEADVGDVEEGVLREDQQLGGIGVAVAAGVNVGVEHRRVLC